MHYCCDRWGTGHVINCGLSEVDPERLSKLSTSRTHVLEIDLTQIYCHDYGTTYLGERLFREYDKAMDFTPEKHTHSAANPVMGSLCTGHKGTNHRWWLWDS